MTASHRMHAATAAAAPAEATASVKKGVAFIEAKDDELTNPVSRKIGPKSMHCERLDGTVVCGGVYKN